MRKLCLGLYAATMLTLSTASFAQVRLAPTPPMGWNSWDVYGPSVKEDEVKANADFMGSKLAAHGWKYVIVDIEWYAPDAHAAGYIPGGRVVLDRFGRFVPSPNRFPDAVNDAGFKPLADYVHSKGLKFGIHIMRGISREAVNRNLPIEGSKFHAADIADKQDVCKWDGMEDTYGVNMSKPGAQEYYDSIARLYARWGVDYVKADDMSRPYHKAEIHALSVALKKTGRPIILSLSPGPAPVAEYGDLKEDANLWRISDDFWDRWVDIKKQFDLTANWQGKSHPGGWPDADMLPLGHIGIRAERGVDRASLLTHDEQVTLMSLWSIFKSPLMFGGDFPSSDAFTIGLLSNDEVLAVDQKSSDGKQAYRQNDVIAWTASSADGLSKYVAVFNTSDAPKDVDLTFQSLGLPAGTMKVRDLWKHQALSTSDRVKGPLRPHAAILYKVAASNTSKKTATRAATRFKTLKQIALARTLPTWFRVYKHSLL